MPLADVTYESNSSHKMWFLPAPSVVNTVAVDENQMPKEPGAINGGITKRNAPGETPVIVIRVSKIDDAVRNVETGGGKVVMPTTKVGERGLYAKVTDTEGNVIGIWQGLMG